VIGNLHLTIEKDPFPESLLKNKEARVLMSLKRLLPQKSSLRISAVLRASAVMTAVKPINRRAAEGSQKYARAH
jgi:hypothetical protein